MLVLALLVAIAPGGAPILKYGVAVQVLAELGRLVRMPVASSRMCTTCQVACTDSEASRPTGN